MTRLFLLLGVALGVSACGGERAATTPASEAAIGAIPPADLEQFLSEAGYGRLEMDRLRTGHFTVSGSADSVSLAMIIDTGASHTLIDTDRAERFDMATHDRGNLATGLGTSAGRTESGRLRNVVIGSMRFDTLRVTVLDLSNVNQVLRGLGNEPVDGVIGADVLMSRRAVIDYGSLHLYFKP